MKPFLTTILNPITTIIQNASCTSDEYFRNNDYFNQTQNKYKLQPCLIICIKWKVSGWRRWFSWEHFMAAMREFNTGGPSSSAVEEVDEGLEEGRRSRDTPTESSKACNWRRGETVTAAATAVTAVHDWVIVSQREEEGKAKRAETAWRKVVWEACRFWMAAVMVVVGDESGGEEEFAWWWDLKLKSGADFARHRLLLSRRGSHTLVPSDAIVLYLREVSFGDTVPLRDFVFDNSLITTFVEHSRPETHMFHLPWGECIIILQDVVYYLRLHVHGEPMRGCFHDFYRWYDTKI
ncbi:hypothetical protein Ahy_A08g038050 [Arachis hypogaea]|uniref:Aminotransferase-like plant mobile domain-containing protein n=1 Tax=Arachis hypogaea TaxID=3818 RepID=A0A445BSH3_ARAHY|nr:hypothetical protein Ahy_A08g038050 [Arachis hypogaea]